VAEGRLTEDRGKQLLVTEAAQREALDEKCVDAGDAQDNAAHRQLQGEVSEISHVLHHVEDVVSVVSADVVRVDENVVRNMDHVKKLADVVDVLQRGLALSSERMDDLLAAFQNHNVHVVPVGEAISTSAIELSPSAASMSMTDAGKNSNFFTPPSSPSKLDPSSGVGKMEQSSKAADCSPDIKMPASPTKPGSSGSLGTAEPTGEIDACRNNVSEHSNQVAVDSQVSSPSKVGSKDGLGMVERSSNLDMDNLSMSIKKASSPKRVVANGSLGMMEQVPKGLVNSFGMGTPIAQSSEVGAGIGTPIAQSSEGGAEPLSPCSVGLYTAPVSPSSHRMLTPCLPLSINRGVALLSPTSDRGAEPLSPLSPLAPSHTSSVYVSKPGLDITLANMRNSVAVELEQLRASILETVRARIDAGAPRVASIPQRRSNSKGPMALFVKCPPPTFGHCASCNSPLTQEQVNWSSQKPSVSAGAWPARGPQRGALPLQQKPADALSPKAEPDSPSCTLSTFELGQFFKLPSLAEQGPKRMREQSKYNPKSLRSNLQKQKSLPTLARPNPKLDANFGADQARDKARAMLGKSKTSVASLHILD
jgi:hypothetical protein